MVSDKESYFGRLKRRLTEDLDKIDAAAMAESAQAHGATHASQCCRGDEVTIIGRLRSVDACAKDGNPLLEAEIFDGTDAVKLVWIGRRRIPGIEPGRTLMVHGRVGERGSSKIIFNPRYELQGG